MWLVNAGVFILDTSVVIPSAKGVEENNDSYNDVSFSLSYKP